MSDDDILPESDEADQPFDAGDPAQVKRRETVQQIKERESARFWERIFADPVGRLEMWRLINAANPFDSTFQCGPNGFPQPDATFYTLGAQSVTMRMYQTWLSKFPLLVMEMHKENDPRFMPPPKKPRKRKGDE